MAAKANQSIETSLAQLPDQLINAGGLYGCSRAYHISRLAQIHKRWFIVITPDMNSANRLSSEINFFLNQPDFPVLTFPDWETLPYDVFSPHQDIISDRLLTLHKLRSESSGILIVSATTVIQRLPPLSYLDQHCLLLKVGDSIDISTMRQRFEQSGYQCVSEVFEHGEFAVRGSLVDLYPMGSSLPFRIDLFDDEVDTIRTFDPETQRTIEQVEQISMLPAREFPVDEKALTRFRKKFRTCFEGDPRRSPIYNDISDKVIPNGIEYYLPLFYDEALISLFDYIINDFSVITLAETSEGIRSGWREILHRYEQRRHDIERPLLEPDMLFITESSMTELLGQQSGYQLSAEKLTGSDDLNFHTSHVPAMKIQPRHDQPCGLFSSFLENHEGRTIICADSAGRREAILEVLSANRIFPKKFDDWNRFISAGNELGIVVAPLEEGAVIQLESNTIAVIAEPQLMGDRARQQSRRKRTAQDNEFAIKNLSDLLAGAAVVHIDHGVGRYIGLQTLTVDGQVNEFVTIEYANDDKLYVPVASLHLISRYNGPAGDKTPLHRLGSDQWEKAKRKARERARDVAAELLEIYARRADKKGHRYHFDHMDYQRFAEAFPFEETPDQIDAIEAVIRDMESEQPMDRVVCGDVGFGKTEVAMRAALAGVLGGKQVALMVPTTLLAQQHYQNFTDRFADWPFKVASMSRFETKKQQAVTLEELENGKTDIVIGTHRLLQNDVRFKNLGLLIIDEEHRFGVAQKEKFKKLRSEVDILTLTATPIPRTLNMALASMRDLSIIATPPAKRLAVKTFVTEWNNILFREAFLREIKRGGQIYFLHNDVKTIEKMVSTLEELIPEANIRFAHGQMREKELEQVMLDFYHQRFNVLVCTTIIESGIDIPSANTIIINRADKLGLAQLHQLRGRVGRSHHRAYAYLVKPPRAGLTPDATKRLEAIEALEDLGAGFMLANHDLEIRGAGEFLGDEQSGHMQEIGYSLFMDMLERAVKALRNGEIPQLDDMENDRCEVDLHIPAILPDDYLPDVHSRLVLYKRIASASSEEELDDLQVEMIDRFGLLPEPAKRLFIIAQIRLMGQNLGISKIDIGPKGGIISFNQDNQINIEHLLDLIQHQPDRYKLEGQDKLKIMREMEEPETRLEVTHELLTDLATK